MINESTSGGTSRQARDGQELEPPSCIAPGDADPVGAGRGRLPNQSDPLRRRARNCRERGDRPLFERHAGWSRRDGLAALLSAVLGCRCELSQPAIGPQPLPLPPLPRGLRGHARRLYRRNVHRATEVRRIRYHDPESLPLEDYIFTYRGTLDGLTEGGAPLMELMRSGARGAAQARPQRSFAVRV